MTTTVMDEHSLDVIDIAFELAKLHGGGNVAVFFEDAVTIRKHVEPRHKDPRWLVHGPRNKPSEADFVVNGQRFAYEPGTLELLPVEWLKERYHD